MRRGFLFSQGSSKFRGSSQNEDNTNTVIGQMSHTLTANSPVKDMVFKSFLNELMSPKVAKENYKQKYQQVKASVAPTAAIPIPTRDAIISNPKPPITIATMTTALQECRTTSAIKPKAVVSSTSTAVTSKTTSKTGGPAKNTRG